MSLYRIYIPKIQLLLIHISPFNKVKESIQEL